MSLNLSIHPHRRLRKRMTLLIFFVLVLLVMLVVLRQGWTYTKTVASLNKTVFPLSVIAPPAVISSKEADQTIKMASKVVKTPNSEAYTANLYLDKKQQTVTWPNAGGRTKIITYTVQTDDTIWSIATRFELDIDTLRWSNPDLEHNPDVLFVGTELLILPVKGVYHRVIENNSIESLAVRYGVLPTDITDYPPNALYPPYDLRTGQGLIIPFGVKDIVKLPQPSLSAGFPLAWPIAGYLTNGFSAEHKAIDIGAPYGSTVYAADGGTVLFARWSQDYGYMILINHGDMVTLYAHLKGAYVQANDRVERGFPIGAVGSTGNSTGPHIHFELRIDNQRVNPFDYLSNKPQ